MLIKKVRTRKTFEEKINHEAPGTVRVTTPLNNWEKFSFEKFQSNDIIDELKLTDEDTLWDTLQE